MKRLKALLESGLLLGIVYLVYQIIYFAYGYLVYYGIREEWNYFQIDSYSRLVSTEEIALQYVQEHILEYTVLCWGVIFLIFLLVAIGGKQKIGKLFALKTLSIKNNLASMLTGLGLVFVMNGFIRFIGETLDRRYSYLIVHQENIYNLITLFIIVGVITPIFEELFFRGIILSRLKKGFGSAMGIFLSSIVFSISHLNVVQSIYVLPIGLLAGYLVIRTNSILAGIWVHIVYNTVNIYLVKVDFSWHNPMQLILIMGLGGMLLAFGLYQTTSDG